MNDNPYASPQTPSPKGRRLNPESLFWLVYGGLEGGGATVAGSIVFGFDNSSPLWLAWIGMFMFLPLTVVSGVMFCKTPFWKEVH